MLLIGRNVNSVWPQALRLLEDEGVAVGSRNGAADEYPGPVVTQYDAPWERVLFDPIRDANPFLHLFDALWILGGRNDVAFLDQFAGNMKNYSDDGQTFHGAYGARLRWHFGQDQLERAVTLLRGDLDTRRAVLQLWDPTHDLGKASKDLPCNTTVYLKVRAHRLHMTVCNRSNDIVWGLYGANAVQFSLLQEYLAAKISVASGPLTHISDSFHAYKDNETWATWTRQRWSAPCPYEAGLVAPWPLVDVASTFDDELRKFLNRPTACVTVYRNSFFARVAEPLYLAWQRHKSTQDGLAVIREELALDKEERPIDWLKAAESWLARRERQHSPEHHARRPAQSPQGKKRGGRSGAGARPHQVRRQLAQKRGRRGVS